MLTEPREIEVEFPQFRELIKVLWRVWKPQRREKGTVTFSTRTRATRTA